MVNPSPLASRVGDKSPLSVIHWHTHHGLTIALLYSVRWTHPPGFLCHAWLPNSLTHALLYPPQLVVMSPAGPHGWAGFIHNKSF